MNQTILDQIVQNTVSHKDIHGAVFHVSSLNNSLELVSAHGNISAHDPYYIASINKFMVSAITLRLCHQKRISLVDKISKYLSEDMISNLLTINKRDYSGEITIQHLISHTSGLPCYLTDKQRDGTKNMDLILNGDNQSWPFDKMVNVVKNMKARYIPGKKGKANYSETNFRLLEKIVEKVTNKSIDRVLTSLFEELGMRNTFVLLKNNYRKIVPCYFKDKEIMIHEYWESTRKDIASTAQDTMIFLKAFFSGHFFPKKNISQLEMWNKIFFPFKYGIGLQLFYIPALLSPFKGVPKIIGHCGSSGAISFYVPAKKVFITGTVNQTSNKGIAFQTLIKIIKRL